MRYHYRIAILLLCIGLLACLLHAAESVRSPTASAAAEPLFRSSRANLNLIQYIDPFIGTGGHGHTFPGPCVPHGFVQLSPDTGRAGWDWCSGYHDTDTSIMGFSHTHLSGTGCTDLGDILLMPYTGNWKVEAGTRDRPDTGYRSVFSHADEKTGAGYYSVTLKSYNIDVKLTATTHCGFHRYIFPESDQSDVILDLAHGISNHTTESRIEILGKNGIRGFRRVHGWASDRYVYFYVEFSKPFYQFATVIDNIIHTNVPVAYHKSKDFKTWDEAKNLKALLRFRTKAGEVIYVKIGLSAVSEENALNNLKSEIPGWNFEKIRTKAADAWESEMDKIVVQGGTDAQKRTFYTALYHALLQPYLYTDDNGEYRGMDNKIHTATNFTYYTLFSLWDTFRAAHPLYSIIEPGRNLDYVKTFLTMYDQIGRLPRWELHANDTFTMPGYHSVPVIADAYLKGYGQFDIHKAFQAMKDTADKDEGNLHWYMKYGYIPYDKANHSVSITLEYAYDDWCIAQVAKRLGYNDDYERFITRAQYYKHVFDPTIGFMRGKDSNGNWRPDFNPSAVSLGTGDFTEGNSWQYTFYVLQDIDGLVQLMGGDKKFSAKLDELFNQPTPKADRDVSGLIGQYAQGNEPSHHLACLYDYVGQCYKTQQRVREIMALYSDERDGLPGNEDCGQMSAWYVFSAMGFYPVNPADGKYAIGSPVFKRVTINLPNGKQFVVKAHHVSGENEYIQSSRLNGKTYSRSYITHADITNGGQLAFVMGKSASHWGCAERESPVSEIK